MMPAIASQSPMLPSRLKFGRAWYRAELRGQGDDELQHQLRREHPEQREQREVEAVLLLGAFGELGVAAIRAVIGPPPEEIDAQAQTPRAARKRSAMACGPGSVNCTNVDHASTTTPSAHQLVDVAWVFQRNGNEPERREADASDDEIGEEDRQCFGHRKITHESLK
jgi:hypothetical protein